MVANNQKQYRTCEKNIVFGKKHFLQYSKYDFRKNLLGEIIDFDHPKISKKKLFQVIKYRVGTDIIYKINASTDVLTSEILKT